MKGGITRIMNLKTMLFFDIALLAVAIVLGIVLAATGKPYNAVIFNIHKLAALASIVFTVIICVNLLKNGSVSGIYLPVVLVSSIVTVALFVTGALMSADNPAYNILKIGHIVSSILLTACEIAIIIRAFEKLQ
jgi:hypothetical protein